MQAFGCESAPSHAGEPLNNVLLGDFSTPPHLWLAPCAGVLEEREAENADRSASRQDNCLCRLT